MLIQSLDSFLAKQPDAHRAHADAFSLLSAQFQIWQVKMVQCFPAK
jgi:hypothetical protein